MEDTFTADERAQPEYVAARGVIADVERFDAALFGMRPREATLMDPQHRVFLEVAWEAFEDAGYPPMAPGRPVGVFAGCSLNTYLLRHVCGGPGAAERFASEFQVGNYEALTGAIADTLATRVSYKLDLRGPSMSIATACSTSLTAVAQAVQSLLLHQCDMALAGGVSISFPQQRGYISQEGGIVSTDGVCRPFDANANGTVFGSGAAAVLLKRLEDAIADDDHIYAVIRGAGVNNDGASKVGFAAPSVDAQAEVIATAHAIAGIDPATIGYVECHGTATPLGDPIEIAALAKAFGPVEMQERCLIGSVKGNVGHLDAAAGVTGLIKAALAVESGTIPATANFSAPNPLLSLETTPFAVAARRESWPSRPGPRRAGVSALGVGGTNVHVVLEQAPAAPRPRTSAATDTVQVLPLSARTRDSVGAAAQALADHLEATPGSTSPTLRGRCRPAARFSGTASRSPVGICRAPSRLCARRTRRAARRPGRPRWCSCSRARAASIPAWGGTSIAVSPSTAPPSTADSICSTRASGPRSRPSSTATAPTRRPAARRRPGSRSRRSSWCRTPSPPSG